MLLLSKYTLARKADAIQHKGLKDLANVDYMTMGLLLCTSETATDLCIGTTKLVFTVKTSLSGKILSLMRLLLRMVM